MDEERQEMYAESQDIAELGLEVELKACSNRSTQSTLVDGPDNSLGGSQTTSSSLEAKGKFS